MNSFEQMKIKELQVDAATAREFLSYNKRTGVIKWAKRTSNRIRVGDNAGSVRSVGKGNKKYLIVNLFGSRYQCHRVAWLLHYGQWPDGQIDHEDGNGMNNRISNLKTVNRLDQQRNLRLRSSSNSGVTGVHFSKQAGRWQATIFVHGRKIHLGFFDELKDASRARLAANKKYGFHQNHGKKR